MTAYWIKVLKSFPVSTTSGYHGFDYANPPAPYEAVQILRLCGMKVTKVTSHDVWAHNGPKYSFEGTIEDVVGTPDLLSAIEKYFKHYTFVLEEKDGTIISEFGDGTVVYKKPDGTVITKGLDGTVQP